MKLLTPLVGIIFSVPVFAASTQPVLVKVQTSVTGPSYSHATTCSLYDDRIEIKAAEGSVSATTITDLVLDKSVATAITNAATGKFSGKPVVGVKFAYTAYDATASDPTSPIQLKSNSGVNNSTSAAELINLLDRLCR